MDIKVVLAFILGLYQALDLQGKLNERTKFLLSIVLVTSTAIPIAAHLIIWAFGHGPKLMPIVVNFVKLVTLDFYPVVERYLYLKGYGFYCSQKERNTYYVEGEMLFLVERQPSHKCIKFNTETGGTELLDGVGTTGVEGYNNFKYNLTVNSNGNVAIVNQLINFPDTRAIGFDEHWDLVLSGIEATYRYKFRMGDLFYEVESTRWTKCSDGGLTLGDVGPLDETLFWVKVTGHYKGSTQKVVMFEEMFSRNNLKVFLYILLIRNDEDVISSCKESIIRRRMIYHCYGVEGLARAVKKNKNLYLSKEIVAGNVEDSLGHSGLCEIEWCYGLIRKYHGEKIHTFISKYIREKKMDYEQELEVVNWVSKGCRNIGKSKAFSSIKNYAGKKLLVDFQEAFNKCKIKIKIFVDQKIKPSRSCLHILSEIESNTPQTASIASTAIKDCSKLINGPRGTTPTSKQKAFHLSEQPPGLQAEVDTNRESKISYREALINGVARNFKKKQLIAENYYKLFARKPVKINDRLKESFEVALNPDTPRWKVRGINDGDRIDCAGLKFDNKDTYRNSLKKMERLHNRLERTQNAKNEYIKTANRYELLKVIEEGVVQEPDSIRTVFKTVMRNANNLGFNMNKKHLKSATHSVLAVGGKSEVSMRRVRNVRKQDSICKKRIKSVRKEKARHLRKLNLYAAYKKEELIEPLNGEKVEEAFSRTVGIVIEKSRAQLGLITSELVRKARESEIDQEEMNAQIRSIVIKHRAEQMDLLAPINCSHYMRRKQKRVPSDNSEANCSKKLREGPQAGYNEVKKLELMVEFRRIKIQAELDERIKEEKEKAELERVKAIEIKRLEDERIAETERLIALEEEERKAQARARIRQRINYAKLIQEHYPGSYFKIGNRHYRGSQRLSGPGEIPVGAEINTIEYWEQYLRKEKREGRLDQSVQLS